MRLRKRIFTNSDFADRAGHGLSVLTSDEANDHASRAVIALGHAVARESLPEIVRCEIRDIVGHDPDSAADLFKQFGRQTDASTAQLRRSLLANDVFRSFLSLLVTHYLILVPLTVDDSARYIVRFSYDEQLYSLPLSLRRRIAEAIAWKAPHIWIAAPTLSDVAYYNLEIEAPEGLQFSARYFYGAQRQVTGRHSAQRRRGGFQTARFYIQGATSDATVLAVVSLRPRPSSIVRASFLTSVVAFLILVTLAWRAPHLSKNVEAIIAISLLPIGTASALASRPFEQTLTTTRLFGLRILALLPALWTLIPALGLAGNIDEKVLRIAWWVSAGLTAFTAAVLGQTWRASRRFSGGEPLERVKA